MNTLNITQYERRYRQPLSDLFFASRKIFSHLDWHTTDQWLATPQHFIRLAWSGGELVGVMGIGAPVDGAAWLRLLMLHDKIGTLPVVSMLWQDLAPLVKASHTQWICAMQLEEWLGQYLAALGFQQLDMIVTMIRNGETEILPPINTTVALRTALHIDTWAILRVDASAFDAPWQLSEEDLRYARRQTSNCSVALLDNEVVGYQLSTSFQQHGHLARLAVVPDKQRCGIGAALVADMIQRFARRNIHVISVNTQASNQGSQRLYSRFGFQHSGLDLPFWQINL